MTDLTSRWEARARLALAGQSVDRATAGMVLDEVDLHCAVCAALAQTGVAVLVAGVCVWVRDGTMLTVTPAGVAGSALLWSAARHKPGPGHTELTMGSHPLPENWLVDLPRLLEERHGLSRSRAAELTREATHHLTATGCFPQEEFGPVELYALQLAEGQSVPRTRWWMRHDAQAAALAVILVGYLMTNLASAGPVWQTVPAVVALVTELALLTVSLLRKRPAASTPR